MLCSWMIPYLYQSIIDKGIVEKKPSYYIEIIPCSAIFLFGLYILFSMQVQRIEIFYMS